MEEDFWIAMVVAGLAIFASLIGAGLGIAALLKLGSLRAELLFLKRDIGIMRPAAGRMRRNPSNAACADCGNTASADIRAILGW